jgi:polysaccharide pyruvyl transferase WcaK-like protein
MYIQIDNAGFYNKGAELMLQAVIQRLSQETTLQPKFVAGTGCTAPDNLQIRKAGLYQIPKFFRFHYRLDKLLPQFALDPYGLAKEESVNAIIDAGGFQFGDQWSYGYSKETNKALSQYYRRYKNQGAKIIFLPQAFGPFTNPLARERVKLVFDYADIIYAREKVSYQYLMEIFGENEKIKLAPDFTNLVEPLANPSLLKQIRGGVCLIPNARMTDKTDESVANSYEDFLHKTTELILSKNEHLILLNHEGPGDWQLIQNIKAQFPNHQEQITAINNLNALEVKAVIGNCKLLITSRFHGLVSGLNQQVPTLCTSWNHKYEELINEYSVKDSLLDTTNEIQFMSTLNNALAYPEKYRPSIQTIDKLKTKSISMWNEVLEVISS